MQRLCFGLVVLLCAEHLCSATVVEDLSVPDPPPGFVLGDGKPNNGHANQLSLHYMSANPPAAAQEEWIPPGAIPVDGAGNQTQGDAATGFLIAAITALGFCFVAWLIGRCTGALSPEPQPVPEPQRVPGSEGIMNHKQRKWLWIGTIVFVLMGLFPPCYGPGRGESDYTFLFLPLLEADTYWRIDMHRLCVQWAIVAVLTGRLLLTFHDTRATKPTDELGE
jgi:hypothetical protein